MDQLLLNLSIKSRAALVRKEMTKQGVSADELRDTMKEMIQHDQEIVDLAEQIALQADLEAKTYEERQEFLNKLAQAVQSGVAMVAPQEPEKSVVESVRKVLGTVLIIEPEVDLAKLYGQEAANLDYAVRHAVDGAAGLDIIRKEKPDLVMLELKLPKLHGLDIISALKHDDDIKDFKIPIVIVTSHRAFEGDFEVQTYPQYRFLIKPAKKEAVRAALQELLPAPPGAGTPDGEAAAPAPPPVSSMFNEDLQKARAVQAKLLPAEIPDVEGYDVGAFYCSCLDVGGDYYDIIPLDEHRTGFMIADVSGKGVSGAMVMVMFRSVVRMLAPQFISPRELMIEVNNFVAPNIKLGMFVTALYMILDDLNHTATITCCGHNPPVIWSTRRGEAYYMNPSGMAVGIMKGEIFAGTLKEVKLVIDPGDRLMIYTDGVAEAMSPVLEEFGEERLAEIIKVHHDRPSAEVIDAVFQGVKAHEDTAPRHDDITMVTFRLKP